MMYSLPTSRSTQREGIPMTVCSGNVSSNQQCCVMCHATEKNISFQCFDAVCLIYYVPFMVDVLVGGKEATTTQAAAAVVVREKW